MTETPEVTPEPAFEAPPSDNVKEISQADKNRIIEIHRFIHSELAMLEIFAEEYAGVDYLLEWLKASFDKKSGFKVPEGTTDLMVKKIYHDNYSTCGQLLSTRVKHKHHAMAPVVESVSFCRKMAAELRAQIELVEPPKPAEPQAHVMDLTHIKPKTAPEAVQ